VSHDIQQRERPILFRGEMVRAILAGQKTQTRRLVKVDDGKVKLRGKGNAWLYLDFDGVPGLSWRPYGGASTRPYDPEAASPYGMRGDRLWVREAFRLRADQDDKPPSQDWWKTGAWYEADGNCDPCGCGGGAGRLRPSIHMPRWASRLTLEVTDVRVQRLQEISGNDVAAEMGWPPCNRGPECPCARNMFRPAWDRIYGKRATWASNPWCWAITFRKVEP